MTRKALIAGGGTMGAGIAAIFCADNWHVQVVEPHSETADTLRSRVAGCLEQVQATGTAPTVIASLDAVDWENVDVVVECLPEDLAIKQAFFAQSEILAPAATILASNSSSFPISAIADGLATKHRMAGLHFFMPAHLVPLVEVISGEATAPDTASALCEMMTSLGKRPVHVRKDIPGFLANRIQHALMREALSLADQGIASPEDIDAAVQLSFGMRFLGAGPFLQKDLAGLDIHHAAGSTIYPSLCNDTSPSPFIAERVRNGDLGVKTGRGFYDWDEDKITAERKRYETALLAALKVVDPL
jgi:3-hydroxybutyryl-CoA dehydrogenase